MARFPGSPATGPLEAEAWRRSELMAIAILRGGQAITRSARRRSVAGMALDPDVITATDLERLSPDEWDAAIRARMVTAVDQADPNLVAWPRMRGEALLDAFS